MAATITVFPRAQTELLDGTLDLDNADVYKVLLLTNAYTYDASDRYVSDLTLASNEHDGTYTRQVLGTRSVSYVANTGAKFDAADTTFSSVGAGTKGDLRYAVVYRQIGGDDTTPANDELICIVNFGVDVTPSGNDVIITWNASGIFGTA